ncbi:MAG: nuclear transport factor 2 family protein [Burkholderiales bacterium]
MPSQEALERFIARVEENAHIEAIQEFHLPESSMQENQAEPRVGRERHMESEKQMLARVKSMHSQCVRPVFVAGDCVVIRWIFEIQWQDGGTTRLEELAYQHWTGDRIAKEQFFYDPAQRKPKAS